MSPENGKPGQPDGQPETLAGDPVQDSGREVSGVDDPSLAEEAPSAVAAGAESADSQPGSETPGADQSGLAVTGSELAESASNSGDGGDGGGKDGDGADGSDAEEGSARMTLMEHLLELRKRLMWIAIGAGIGFLICYPFAEQLFGILMAPMIKALTKVSENATVLPVDFFAKFQAAVAQGLEGTDFPYMDQLPIFFDALQQSMVKVVLHQGQFIYTYPPEAFFAHVKVGAVAGFFVMSPFLFYQLWCFVAPGLYSHERRWIMPIAVISAVFFVSGALFGYFIVFPFGFEFFASYTSDMISFTPKLSEYLGFSLRLLLAFGLIFELPIFIFFLSRLGIVNHKGLRRVRKYAILVAFIVAAILTPPDPFTQTLMAGPLVILYEIGIWVAFIFGKKPKSEENKSEAGAEEKAAEEPLESGAK